MHTLVIYRRGMVSYGDPSWPSRCEWIVPGCHGWYDREIHE